MRGGPVGRTVFFPGARSGAPLLLRPRCALILLGVSFPFRIFSTSNAASCGSRPASHRPVSSVRCLSGPSAAESRTVGARSDKPMRVRASAVAFFRLLRSGRGRSSRSRSLTGCLRSGRNFDMAAGPSVWNRRAEDDMPSRGIPVRWVRSVDGFGDGLRTRKAAFHGRFPRVSLLSAYLYRLSNAT